MWLRPFYFRLISTTAIIFHTIHLPFFKFLDYPFFIINIYKKKEKEENAALLRTAVSLRN